MDSLYIIKIGGAIIDDEPKLKQFIALISSIKERKIIVHGGGKQVDKLALTLGIQQQMMDGRRITDADTLQLATMVYAGLINKRIVALMQAQGDDALGLSGADANCIQAKKRIKSEIDFGFVGDIPYNGINTAFLSMLLEQEIVPVFCSITHDKEGQLLNTNADTLASALSVAMSNRYEVQLHYCFEKKGVLHNVNDENAVIPNLTMKQYQELRKNNIVAKGMIPKLDTAFDAVTKGVKTVVILSAEEILTHIHAIKNVGTHLTA